MIKNYFRILKKPHAYLQTILNTSVKFQKDRTETVGGVKGTKFVCVEVLRPSQPNGVMSSAVSLPNHTFTGQA